MNDVYQEFQQSIHRIHPIREDLLNKFTSDWQSFKAVKRVTLTETGSIERYLYFVIKGVQKAYFNYDGNALNIAFSYPFGFTCVPESFITQKPSRYSWKTITDSEFLRISYDKLFEYINSYPEFETLLRKKITLTLHGLGSRYHRMVTLDMESRFRSFMNNSSHLINEIPHKEIANYLKIDPTNFSKLLNTIRI